MTTRLAGKVLRRATIVVAAALGGVTAATQASSPWDDPYPSTYHASPSVPVLIRAATVLTGTGARLDATDVLLADGKIAAIGTNLVAPTGARLVDAASLADAGDHRRALASRRVPEPGDRRQQRRQRGDRAGHRERLGEHSVWPVRSGVLDRASPAASRRSRSCRDRPT